MQRGAIRPSPQHRGHQASTVSVDTGHRVEIIEGPMARHIWRQKTTTHRVCALRYTVDMHYHFIYAYDKDVKTIEKKKRMRMRTSRTPMGVVPRPRPCEQPNAPCLLPRRVVAERMQGQPWMVLVELRPNDDTKGVVNVPSANACGCGVRGCSGCGPRDSNGAVD